MRFTLWRQKEKMWVVVTPLSLPLCYFFDCHNVPSLSFIHTGHSTEDIVHILCYSQNSTQLCGTFARDQTDLTLTWQVFCHWVTSLCPWFLNEFFPSVNSSLLSLLLWWLGHTYNGLLNSSFVIVIKEHIFDPCAHIF